MALIPYSLRRTVGDAHTDSSNRAFSGPFVHRANSRASTWRWPACLRPRLIKYLARGAFEVDLEFW
jgi:hypothetical protein